MLSRVNYTLVNDLVTSTLVLTYYFHDRDIISKQNGITQLLTSQLRVYLYQGKLVMSLFIHTLK